MVGLVVLFVFGVYLTVSAMVVFWAARFTKKKGRSPWLGGMLGVLFMYLIVFWDHIPTKIMFHHYCNKEAGVWIYKTVEQWEKENPAVAETLKPYNKENRPDVITSEKGPHSYSQKVFLNPRFAQVITEQGILPINVFRKTYEIVDTKTGKIMACFIDFRSGYGNNPIELGSPNGLKGFKIWLAKTECLCSPKYHKTFSDYRKSIINIGGRMK